MVVGELNQALNHGAIVVPGCLSGMASVSSLVLELSCMILAACCRLVSKILFVSGFTFVVDLVVVGLVVVGLVGFRVEIVVVVVCRVVVGVGLVVVVVGKVVEVVVGVVVVVVVVVVVDDDDVVVVGFGVLGRDSVVGRIFSFFDVEFVCFVLFGLFVDLF